MALNARSHGLGAPAGWSTSGELRRAKGEGELKLVVDSRALAGQ